MKLAKFAISSISIGGVPIDAKLITLEANHFLTQAAGSFYRRYVRQLYGHHLPKRVRK
jgi:hypothetical protein